MKPNPITRIEVGSYLDVFGNVRIVLRFWRKNSKHWNCAYAMDARTEHRKRERLQRILRHWFNAGLIKLESDPDIGYDGIFQRYTPVYGVPVENA